MKSTICWSSISLLVILHIIFYPILVYPDEDEVVYIDIQDITHLALRNNFDIKVYQLDHLISKEDLQKARSIYDTTLKATYNYDENRLDPASVLFGKRTTTVEQTIELSKKLPSGTALSLAANHKRGYTDSIFFTPNPHHDTKFGIDIRQPILKNRLGLQDRYKIKITEIDIENSGYTSLDKIEEELASVQRLYWSFVLAQSRLDVYKDILSASQQLFVAGKRNLKLGIIEEPEYFAIKANLDERWIDLKLAEELLNRTENTLIYKINLKKDIQLKAKDKLELDNYEIDKVRVFNEAFRSRRDYKRLKNLLKENRIRLKMDNNALWPKLDLIASFKVNNVDEKFVRSYRDIFSEFNPEYIAKIEFSLPLENRNAKSELQKTRLRKIRLLTLLKKLECLILVEVDNNVSRLITLRDAVKFQQRSMKMQRLKYLSERRRFKQGRSDTERLIRYQQDYLHSRIKYLDMVYEYKCAEIDLKLTLNSLLGDVEGVDIERNSEE